MYVFEGDMYCLTCYKDNLVSQCSTETLFKDLLLSKEGNCITNRPCP
jgi:hypothetical protein